MFKSNEWREETLLIYRIKLLYWSEGNDFSGLRSTNAIHNSLPNYYNNNIYTIATLE